jgi:hypothetical protein
MKNIFILNFLLFTIHSNAQNIELKLSNETGSLNNNVTLKLTTKDFANVMAFQFSVNFDPSVLEYQTLSSSNPTPLGFEFGTNNTTSGQIGALWIDPALVGSSLPDNTEILQLNFKVIGGSGTTTSLTVGETPTPVAALDGGLAYTRVTSVSGSVTIAPVLPIELVAFSAKWKDKNSVALNWQTATENKAAFFAVEQGINGRDFQNIGTVKAFGSTTTPQYYSFIHDNPAMPLNYYRLKMVDINGEFDYSKIVSIAQNTEGGISIKKHGNRLIISGLESNSAAEITLSDLMGRSLFFQKKAANTEGGILETLPLLSSGFYIATARSKQGFHSAKIFIE